METPAKWLRHLIAKSLAAELRQAGVFDRLRSAPRDQSQRGDQLNPHLHSARRYFPPLLAAFLLFLFISITSAPGQQADSFAQKRTQLEGAISKYMSANGVPGLSAAFVQDGQIRWAEGFGMADLENFVPATYRTLYRLASASKPLTATAAMQLWERGKLDLDAPVQKYCPQFPEAMASHNARSAGAPGGNQILS